MTRSVTTPTGETWRVGRRWLPRRQVRWKAPPLPVHKRTPRRERRRGSRLDWLDGLDLVDADNPLAGVAFLLGVVVVAAIVWFFLVPLLLVLLDAAVLLVLAAAGVIAKVVLRRPWEVEAVGPADRLTWRVVGWGRSRRAVAAVTQRLGRGEVPPTDSPSFPPR